MALSKLVRTRAGILSFFLVAYFSLFFYRQKNKQNPNCIKANNAEFFVSGTINGVIQPPEVFTFQKGYLVFLVDLQPNEDAEFCVIYDPAVDFSVSGAINQFGYDVKFEGGTPPVKSLSHRSSAPEFPSQVSPAEQVCCCSNVP